MAINLWKLAGKPIVYSPLTTGFTSNNSITIGISDFKVTFKAKSPTNKRLALRSGDTVDFYSIITLTPEFKNYEYIISSKKSQPCYLYDMDSSSDIIIESIELVQKPLSKLTVNKPTKRTPIKPKTGTSFNGTSDYVQFTSMTMDSIEIDCLIESVQNSKYIVDARTGLANGYLYTTSGGSDLLGSGFSSVTVNGNSFVAPYPRNQRIKIKLNSNTPFTDDVNIFSASGGAVPIKGTLYKVTCYLAGKIVAQYDFENPSNIVGDKVLQSVQNLIPSFEDSKWSLHANTQMFGKDVLRLNATVGYQFSEIFTPILPNTKYLIQCDVQTLSGQMYTNWCDSNKVLGVGIGAITKNTPKLEATSPSNAGFIRTRLENTAIGTFDFIKPQLYQLDGKEITLFGKPIQLNKASKQTKYSIR